MVIGTSHPHVTREQHRLLGGWRNVAEDVRRFAAALRAIPDGCSCGDGPAHLRGACACCQSQARRAECLDCEVLLHGLAWRADAVIDDTSRFLPAVKELLSRIWPEDGEAYVRDVQQRIARVARMLTQMETAAGEFARGCNLDQLQQLRTATAELLANVDELDDLLVPRR